MAEFLNTHLTEEEHAGLHEEVAKFFEKAKDGKYLPKLKGPQGWVYVDAAALNKALKTERDGRADAIKHLSKYGDYDKEQLAFSPAFDPKDAADAITKVAEFADSPPVGDEALAALKEEFAKKERKNLDKLQAEVNERQAVIDKQEDSFKRLLVSDRAKTALLMSKCLPEYVELLQGHIEKMSKVVNTDNGREVRLIGTDGVEIPTMEAGSIDPMKYKEFIETNLRDRYPGAFAGTGATGTGATGVERTSGAKIDQNLSGEERLKQHYRSEAKKQ